MRITRLLIAALSTGLLSADPTEEREWTSSSGTTIQAKAMMIREDKVLLETSDGRKLTVPLDKFADDDRTLLIEHFGLRGTVPEKGVPLGSQGTLIEDGLAHPVGEVTESVDAGGGSHYHVYIPKSLRQSRPAPMMLITGSGGGKPGLVRHHIEGAETNGWIVAASVESRNSGDHPVGNHEHSKRCVEHLLQTLPIDGERVYFTGDSGGGAMAFYNVARIKSAGAMPMVGYIPDDQINRKGQYFIFNGTTDFNRYTSAHAAARFGKNAIHRFYPGNHNGRPPWLKVEGMAWLNGRYLKSRGSDDEFSDERLDYEVAMIAWIRRLAEKEAHRAHYWCVYLRDDYEISGHNAGVLDTIFRDLDDDPANQAYTAGIAAIDEFSDKHYSAVGSSSFHEHTTPQIQRAAGQLAEKYGNSPQIREIATQLGNVTQK